MLVLAGPGSGKTTVISERIRYLIEEKGVEPSRILSITYTKAAASEMKDRCIQRCPKAVGTAFGTYHSVFYHFLRSAKTYQNISILEEKEKYSMMKCLYNKSGAHAIKSDDSLRSLIQRISYMKNVWPAETYESDDMIKLFEYYGKMCREAGKIDLDDILILCHKLFLEYPKEKEKWQNRFSYILVDEFQDINGRQYELIKLLAQGCKNLFVVGDDDQAIYSFRGSNPQYMKRFIEDFPESKKVVLKENYRCGNEIVRISQKCIQNNRFRIPKQMIAARSFENVVTMEGYQQKEEEIENLIHKIQKTQNEKIALLLRTNEAAYYIAEKLKEAGIDSNIVCKSGKWYETNMMKDILIILKFSRSLERKDFMKFMNKPQKGILREYLLEEKVDLHMLGERLQNVGLTKSRDKIWKFERYLNIAKELDAYGAIRCLLTGSEYLEYAKCYGPDSDRELEVLFQWSKKYRSLERLLEAIDLQKEQDAKSGSREADTKDKVMNRVMILTYHAAKGLEFDRVFLPMLCNGAVPHGHMLTSEQMEEERRMFYVAMTRAKTYLHLSWNAEDKDAVPSVFLNELK